MNELTLGYKIVYNTIDCMTPLNNETKNKFADLINEMDKYRQESTSPDVKRLCSIAITKLEEACMFMVKAQKFEWILPAPEEGEVPVIE